VFSCFFPFSTILHKICWWKRTCKNSPRTNCCLQKIPGGKLLVRTHQGLILLHKIAGGKLLVRTCQGLILLHKIAGRKLLVRTHQGWILLHKIAVENNL
jgi:hypothetical protein